MTRLGGMFGPDVTFLGVPRCDLDDASSLEGTDVVIIGAPYDAGTS
jgi:agmatinase